MANERARHFLKQIKKLDRIIENKLAEKELWKEKALKISPQSSGERVQASGSLHKMADAIDKYIDIERDIDNYIDRLVDTRNDVIKTIEQLDVQEYDLLHKTYVQYFTLQEVADMEQKSYSWATTIHGIALANVEKILEERESDG